MGELKLEAKVIASRELELKFEALAASTTALSHQRRRGSQTRVPDKHTMEKPEASEPSKRDSHRKGGQRTDVRSLPSNSRYFEALNADAECQRYFGSVSADLWPLPDPCELSPVSNF